MINKCLRKKKKKKCPFEVLFMKGSEGAIGDKASELKWDTKDKSKVRNHYF